MRNCQCAVKRLVSELQNTIDSINSGCCGMCSEQIDLISQEIIMLRNIMTSNDGTVDVFEACEILGVSKPTIYNWISRGWLPKPIKKHETSLFFNKSDIEKAKAHLKEMENKI